MNESVQLRDSVYRIAESRNGDFIYVVYRGDRPIAKTKSRSDAETCRDALIAKELNSDFKDES